MPASSPAAPLGVPPPRCAQSFLALAPRMGTGMGTFASPHAGWGFHTVTRRERGHFCSVGARSGTRGPPGPVLGKDNVTVPCPAPCQRPAPLQPLPQPLAPLPASHTSPGNYSPPPGTGDSDAVAAGLGDSPTAAGIGANQLRGTAPGRCRGGRRPSGFVRGLSYAPGGRA